MSIFDNTLEFDNIIDESFSNFKTVSSSDISFNINQDNSEKIKNFPEIKNLNNQYKSKLYAAIFLWKGSNKNVYLTGSFCNWLQHFEMIELKRKNKTGEKNTISFLILFLPRGTYQFKFRINSEIWKCNSDFAICSDKDGNINNVITIPPMPLKNKNDEDTAESSQKTLPKLEEVNELFCQQIEPKVLEFFSYKYFFNYDLFSRQNKIFNKYYLPNGEKDILNGNYSYKKILPMKHEIVNHFVIDGDTMWGEKNKYKKITLKYGCTIRYKKKMTTFVYYKPN